MKRRPANRHNPLYTFTGKVLDTIAPTVGSTRARSRATSRTSPAIAQRASGVRNNALPVQGCLIISIIGSALLVTLIVASSLMLNRSTDQVIAKAFPTPRPTPNVAALGAGPVLGPPSIEPTQIRAVLESYNSPAIDEAQAFYDLGVAHGIDPAYCLAFFILESSAGTRGVARTTYSIGNIRARPGEPQFEGYRQYTSWREGIADWYRLIDELYIGEWGLTTVDEIIPIYAPSFDNNDPVSYAWSVKRLVAAWRES